MPGFSVCGRARPAGDLAREERIGLARRRCRAARRHQAPGEAERRGHQRRGDERPRGGQEADARELAAEAGEVEVERLAERPAVADEPLHRLGHPNRRAMQERKTTQPSKTCRKPSAWAMP